MKITAAPAAEKRLPANRKEMLPNLHALINNVADVICSIDTAGRFAFVNDGALQLWGYGPEELAGKPLSDFILDADLPAMQKALRADREQDFCISFENSALRKDGIITSISWSVRWSCKHRLFYCVARDGTAQKAMAQRLLHAQTNAGLANYEYDVCTRMFTYVSGNAYSIFGMQQKPGVSFTAEKLWALVHPSDKEQVQQEMLHPERKLDRCSMHYRIIRPDGSVVYVLHKCELQYNAAGEHIKTAGTFQDVTGQTLSQLALQQSEKRFRALVAGGHDLVGIISSSGIYTYVGENTKRILGFAASELEGRCFTDFIHSDDLPVLNECFEMIVAGQKVLVPHFRFRNSRGEWRWMETRVTDMMHDPHINGFIVNSRDITEEKATNDKLRDLSLIAQESMQAIVITDTRHRITWVNKAFCAISGYQQAEVMGKLPQDIFAITSKDKQAQLMVRQQLQKGLCVQKEVLCHAKSGHPYWIHLQIQPVYNDKKELVQYLSIGEDITERKKATTELALSEQRFKALVQEGSDVIVIVNKEGLFTHCSDSVQKVLGYEPEDLLQQHLLSFIHPDDSAETLAGIERLKKNETTGGVRHRFRQKSGGYIWLESKGTNHFANPLIEGMIVNARDITEKVLLRKKLDAELLNKQKEITSAVIKAQESERSKLGLELHDNVNQVLTTVKLYNEMYLSGYRKDQSLLERSAKYLQDCINEIRSISKRLSAPTLGKITLRDSIQDLVDSINITNKLQVYLHTEGVGHLYIAEDLHLGIYRIIQESLNNMIKYAQATLAEIQIAYTGNILSLVIRDDGRGFDSAAKRKGIGITNMKTRAENLNGVFQIHTAAGKGCVIEVSFLL